MKIRRFEDKNYHAIYLNGKTMRFAIDYKKPIQDLDYPEFYDVKITNSCSGGCSYCYQDSICNEPHFENIVEKIEKYFGAMTENQKPFQVAIGGGEPTSHPKFVQSLESFWSMGITPNYTTNGMWVDNRELWNPILMATKKFYGGVAVSCHKHLRKYWEEAANAYFNNEIMLNFHIVISDKESIDYFHEIYEKWHDKVSYFVLLPYIVTGRAKEKSIDWKYLITKLPEDKKKLAFGANFYPYLCNEKHDIDVILYEPEIMSKYISLEENGKMYKSSFDNEIIKQNFLI